MKWIFTNRQALLNKYGPAGVAQIDTAVDRLIAADAKRRLETRWLTPDSANGLSTADDCKRAIDAALSQQPCDYLMILGGPDVVPFADLINPLHDDAGDTDMTAPGDLPYACERPLSRQITDFVGPTRVVGRLPDLTGANEPSYLIQLIDAAAKHQTRAAPFDYFGLSAEVWRQSTQRSLVSLFGNAERLAIAPPRGPIFPDSALAALIHFINCHGAPADPRFYGQHDEHYPVALHSDALAALQPGTVAAFECCYGGELYDPALTGGAVSIANQYLARGAAGLIASSTIAYGPAVGNAQADLLCVYFMQSLLKGASLGRAFLEARQNYIRNCRVLTPVDLKTISQFVLLGDPSLVPIAASTKTMEPEKSTRRRRRIRLRELGITLPSSVAVTQRLSKAAVPPRVDALIRAELRKLLPQRALPDFSRSTYLVRRPADRSVKSLVLPQRVHVVLGPVGSAAPGPSLAGVIAIEAGDAVDVQAVMSR